MVTQRATHRTEEQHIRELIAFANSSTLGPALAQTPELRRLPNPPRPGTVISASQWADGAALRERLVADLAAITANKNPLPARLQDLVVQARGVTSQIFDIDPADHLPRWNNTYDTLRALASFLTLRVYTARKSESGFPGDLCQCHLARCGHFFWSSDKPRPKGGRPREAFCSPEHAAEHHKLGTPDRVRRYRERQRAAKHK